MTFDYWAHDPASNYIIIIALGHVAGHALACKHGQGIHLTAFIHIASPTLYNLMLNIATDLHSLMKR